MHKELMVNSQTVHSDLGGGTHGHLGLVLSPGRYALISNAAYNRPAHPGQLVIPAGTTLHLARTMRDQHTERLRIFREVTSVENALKQQIVGAVEPQYLQALRDPTTSRLNGTIPEIMKHLFLVYGRVTPQLLYEQEQKVQQMVYDPQHPIDGVFTAIDELVNFAEAAEIPYTQPQCISLGYRIINRTGMFQRWILDWNNKPQVQKNWSNFKKHFRTAHQQLKETTNLQARDSSYHANALQEILQEIREEIQTVKNNTQESQDVPPPLTSVSESSNDSSISALQSEMASLKDYIQNMHQTPLPPQIPPMTQQYLPPPFWNSQYCMPVHPYQGYANQAFPFPTQQQPTNTQQTAPPPKKKRRIFYCWTHGACFHPGPQCRNKAMGHQDSATFQNRMGGSTKNVKGVQNQNITTTTSNT